MDSRHHIANASGQGGAPGPPPRDDGGPTAPDNDPVLAALNQVLMSAAGPPDHAAYLAPFAGAETSVRDAYAKALPKIAAAYDQVRKDLQAGHERSLAERQQTGAARQQTMNQARATVQDDGALRAAIQGLGGDTADAGMSSLVGGAQAQQQVNLNSLDIAQTNENNFASRIGDMAGEMHTDRQGTAGLIDQSAQDLAENYQSKGLSAIAGGKAEAEAKYAQMTQEFAEQKAKIQLQIAEYMRDKPIDDLKRAQEWAKLTGEGVDGDGPRAEDYGELAQKSPAAFGAFSSLVAEVGPRGDRRKAEKVINEGIEEALADGRWDAKNQWLTIDGKRLDLKVIRSWMDEYFRRKGK